MGMWRAGVQGPQQPRAGDGVQRAEGRLGLGFAGRRGLPRGWGELGDQDWGLLRGWGEGTREGAVNRETGSPWRWVEGGWWLWHLPDRAGHLRDPVEKGLEKELGR